MYPLDRRVIALRLYNHLSSLRKTASILGVSHVTISRWLKNPQRKSYSRVAMKSTVIVETIRAAVSFNPFIDTRSLVDIVQTNLGVSVSKELARLAITQKLGLSRKKAKYFARPRDLVERTTAFLQKRRLLLDSKKMFVSLDETSFGRYGKPLHGWAPVGQKLVLPKEPLTKPKPLSTVAIIGEEGLIAKCSRYGSFNSQTFADFLQTLDLPNGTVILMDNASIHRSSLTKETAERKNWEILYLPPYSPWFNPIEEAFSIVKRDYYKHWDAEQAFSSLKPFHCHAFFRSAFGKN